MRRCSAVGLLALLFVGTVGSQGFQRQNVQQQGIQQQTAQTYNLPVQQQIFRDPNTGKYVIFRNNVTIIQNGQRVGSGGLGGAVSASGGGPGVSGGGASTGSLNGGIHLTGNFDGANNVPTLNSGPASTGNPNPVNPMSRTGAQLMAFDLTGLGVEIRQDPVAHIRVTIVQPGQTGSTIPEAGENAPVTGQNITGMYVRKEANMTMGVSADNLLLVGTVVPTSVGGQSYFIPFIRETEIICEGRFHKVEYVGNSTESVHSLIPLFQIAQNQYSTREGIVGGETVLLFPDYFKTPNPPGCEGSTTPPPNSQQPQNNIDQLINEGVAVVKFYKRPRPHFKVSSSYIVGTSGFFVSTTSTFPVVGGELQITGTKTAATGESEYFTVDRRGPDSDDYIQLPVTRTPDGHYQVLVPLTEPASTQPTAPVENTPVDGVPAVVVPNAKLPDDPNNPNNNDNAVMLFIDGEPNLRAKPLTGAEPKPNENGFVIPRLDEYPIQMNSYGIPALTFSGHQWRQSDQVYYLLTTRKPADKEYGQPTETAYGRVVYLELKTISPTEQQVQIPLSDGYSQQQQYRPRIQNDGPTTKIIIADYRGNSNPNNTTPPSGGGGDLDGLVDSGQAGVKVHKRPQPNIIYMNGPNSSPGGGPGLGLYVPKNQNFPVIMENGVPNLKIPGTKTSTGSDMYIPVEKIQPTSDADDWYYAPVRKDGNGGYAIFVPLNPNVNSPTYSPGYIVIDGNTVISLPDAQVPGGGGSGSGGTDVELRLDPHPYLRTLPLSGSETNPAEPGVVIANSADYPIVTNGFGVPELSFVAAPWHSGSPGRLLLTTTKPQSAEYGVPTSDNNGAVVYFRLNLLPDGNYELRIPLSAGYAGQARYSPQIEELYGYTRIIINDYAKAPNGGGGPVGGLDGIVNSGTAAVRVYKQPFHIKYADTAVAGTAGLYVPKSQSFPVLYGQPFAGQPGQGQGQPGQGQPGQGQPGNPSQPIPQMKISGRATFAVGDIYLIVEQRTPTAPTDPYFFVSVLKGPNGEYYILVPLNPQRLSGQPTSNVVYDLYDNGPVVMLPDGFDPFGNGGGGGDLNGMAVPVYLDPNPFFETIPLTGTEPQSPQPQGYVIPDTETYPIRNEPDPDVVFAGFPWSRGASGLYVLVVPKPAEAPFGVRVTGARGPVIYYPIVRLVDGGYELRVPLNLNQRANQQYKPPKELVESKKRVYIYDLRDFGNGNGTGGGGAPTQQPAPLGFAAPCKVFYQLSNSHLTTVGSNCAAVAPDLWNDGCHLTVTCDIFLPTGEQQVFTNDPDQPSVMAVCVNGLWVDEAKDQPFSLPYCAPRSVLGNLIGPTACTVVVNFATHYTTDISPFVPACIGQRAHRSGYFASGCRSTYHCHPGTQFHDYSPPITHLCRNGVFYDTATDQIAAMPVCTDHCPAIHESIDYSDQQSCPPQKFNRHLPGCQMSLRCTGTIPTDKITCSSGLWHSNGRELNHRDWRCN